MKATMISKSEIDVLEVTGTKRDELRMASMPYRQLPETGFVRLRQIIGDPKADPPIPPLIPVGKSTWWEGVKSGRYSHLYASGRCKFHGGRSTGPKTQQGRRQSALNGRKGGGPRKHVVNEEGKT
jgi:hypothetical protein